MRDRLVELLKDFSYMCREDCRKVSIDSLTVTIKDCNECKFGQIADYLLANGVIVPPCKVEQTVYAVDKRSCLWWKGKIISFYYCNRADMQFTIAFEDGEVAIYDADCVFATKEEAEQALKGGGQG